MTSFNSSSALIALDRSEIDERRRWLADALDDDGNLDPAWLRERGWIAVPFEAPIDDAEAEKLARALTGVGTTQGYVLALEEGLEAFGFRFPADVDAILEADAEGSSTETVWATDNAACLLRGDGELYYVVAGPEAFVQEVVGGPVERARAAFEAYAHDPELAGEARARLQDIARALAGLAAG